MPNSLNPDLPAGSIGVWHYPTKSKFELNIHYSPVIFGRAVVDGQSCYWEGLKEAAGFNDQRRPFQVMRSLPYFLHFGFLLLSRSTMLVKHENTKRSTTDTIPIPKIIQLYLKIPYTTAPNPNTMNPKRDMKNNREKILLRDSGTWASPL
jgi:hypothetical protein